jgi:hypothetical protein
MAEAQPGVDLHAIEDFMGAVVDCFSDWPALMELRAVSPLLHRAVSLRVTEKGVLCEEGVGALLGSAFGRAPWTYEEVSQRIRVFTSNGGESSPPLTHAPHPFFERSSFKPVGFNNDVAFVLDRVPRRVFLSGNGVGKWFAVDLGPFVRVRLTGYTLRHSSEQRRALRNFAIEATNEVDAAKAGPDTAITWDRLATHVDDTSLGTEPHATATWTTDTSEAYRYFRVVKTGRDAVGTAYFHLSHFELFGYVQLCW